MGYWWVCYYLSYFFWQQKHSKHKHKQSAIYFYRVFYRKLFIKHIVAHFVWLFILFVLAGQEKFRAMTPMYYRNANAALLCFDLTNYKSFLDVKDWVQELHKYVLLLLFTKIQIFSHLYLKKGQSSVNLCAFRFLIHSILLLECVGIV